MPEERVGRRDFISQGLKSFFQPLAAALSDPTSDEGSGPLRPPGALEESAFGLICRRCGACVRSCPYRAIKVMGERAGGYLGTPYIDPGTGPCYWCMECVKVCPSGALTSDQGETLSIGLAVIDYDRCLTGFGKPCDYCVERCPQKGVAMAFVDGRPVVSKEACTGCGICAHLCPTTPSAVAIRTRRRVRPNDSRP